jgi:aspartate/methionine/tyrosine aminotransferase
LTDAGVNTAPPQGAFYIFPDFSTFKEKLAKRDIHTASEMCERILAETGVAFLPGSEFGRPDSELSARLALVDFDGSKALMKAQEHSLDNELPKQFVTDNCSRVIQATDKLCSWLNR